MQATRVSEERFVVAYRGPAVDDHTMNARDLASAILAMSDAFHQAQHVLTPDTPPAALNVRAFDEGSFEVAMVLVEVAPLLETAMDVLLSRPTQAALTLSGVVGAVWGSVKGLKAIAGRRVRRSEETQPGTTRLTLDDGTVLTIPSDQLSLIRDVEFRKKVVEFVEPVDGHGITEFRVTNTAVSVSVTAADVPALAPPDLPAEEDLGTDRREALLQLLGVEFDGRKWRFTEGGAPLTASIEDLEFRGRIERQEITFGRNDLLRVRLRTRQYRDPAGRLRAEHSIEKVLRHIDGGRQLSLELE